MIGVIGPTLGERYLVITQNEFDEWAKEYADLLIHFADIDNAHGREYLREANERKWWEFWKPDRDWLFSLSASYFNDAMGHEESAQSILNQINDLRYEGRIDCGE